MRTVPEGDATGAGKSVCRLLVAFLAPLCFCAASSHAATLQGSNFSSPQSAASQSATQRPASAPPLELGKSIERELRGGETHVYRIHVEAGQFLHFVVEKKGIDVVGVLIGPDGKVVAITARPTGIFGTEPLSAVVATSGDYLVRVISGNQNAAAGKYEIKVTGLRFPQPADSTRIDAERSFLDAMKLRSQGTADSLQKAAAKFSVALTLSRAIADQSEEAITLNMLGRMSSALGDKQQALDYYNQALLLERAIGDRPGEATTLNIIGLVYDDLGDRRKALEFYGQALSFHRAAGDRSGEASTLSNIGLAYAALGEKQKGLEYYNLALPLNRAAGDRSGEASTLNNIGSAYDSLGDKQKALEYYEQALPLFRAAGNRSGEAAALNNIGLAYDLLGEKQKALEYYEQALPVYHAAGDRSGESTTLVNLGGAYDALGQKQKALDYFNQALPLERAVGDRSGEAVTLNNIGVIYGGLWELQKALDYYSRALPLRRAVGDRFGEANTLNNMGVVYDRLGDKEKALEHYEQALPLRRAIGDRSGEAITLSNLGAVYDSLGDKRKALDFFNHALSLNRAVADRAGEATTLNNIGATYDGLGEKRKALDQYSGALTLERSLNDPLMEATTLGLLMEHWQEDNNPSLAIFFGKQAINSYQQIRRNIQGLEKSAQTAFTGSVEGTYRRLADLLVTQGRLFEAQQVLGLLKEEEFKEFTRDDKSGGAAGTLALTSTETSLDRRYREMAGGAAALWSDWNALNIKSPRTPEEEQRFQALSKQLDDTEQAFQNFVSQDLYEQLGKNKQADASVRELEDKTSDLQSVLHELEPGTVALYTVVAPERLIVILVLPDARIAHDYPIKPEALREKVFALRHTLLSPESDPMPLAQELYKIVLGPVEQDLQAAGAKTLMWSLDDVLRYVPIAALHDGKRYVVENYRNEIFTLSSISKLKNPPYSGQWQALAMGVSKSYGGFSALPTVPSELHGIVRSGGDSTSGVMPGVMLLDDAFTRQAFETGLRQGFPIVHVASHFSFQTSGDDFSFLLLGGTDQAGTHLTLSDIKTDVNIRFWNTELLTLSACESALSGERNGRELDGLGEIAQRKGAKAVIASLWSVNDQSTGALMRKFYEAWTTRPGVTKAEALQQAQMALLRGEVKPDAVGAAPGEPPPLKSFAHPYYWAPFVLIGNWR
ncbi:MAG: tetratricopeptide repeat protein [Candidatus Acidiferrales bacterium]